MSRDSKAALIALGCLSFTLNAVLVATLALKVDVGFYFLLVPIAIGIVLFAIVVGEST